MTDNIISIKTGSSVITEFNFEGHENLKFFLDYIRLEANQHYEVVKRNIAKFIRDFEGQYAPDHLEYILRIRLAAYVLMFEGNGTYKFNKERVVPEVYKQVYNVLLESVQPNEYSFIRKLIKSTLKNLDLRCK